MAGDAGSGSDLSDPGVAVRRKTSENGQDESSPGQNSQSESTDMGDSYETQLETRLKQLLSQVDGVGQAEVDDRFKGIRRKDLEDGYHYFYFQYPRRRIREVEHGRSRAVNSRRIPFYPVLPGQGVPILEKRSVPGSPV